MAIELVARALNLEGLNPTAKLVLVGLCNHANADHICWPSLATLQRYSCAGRTTVKRHLRNLEAARLIQTEPRYAESGRQTANVYRITLDAPAANLDAPGASTPRSNLDPSPRSASGPLPGPPVDPPIEPSIEPSMGEGTRASGDLFGDQPDLHPQEAAPPEGFDSWFDACWAEYPRERRRGKKTAQQIWKREGHEKRGAEIHQDIQQRLESDGRWARGYVKDFERYVRHEQWHDGMEPVDENGAGQGKRGADHRNAQRNGQADLTESIGAKQHEYQDALDAWADDITREANERLAANRPN